MEKILYNDIHLPDKVSDILELDFWALQHVGAAMVRTVTNPVKFSAYTSIFVTRGTAEADINLIAHRLEAPCVINVSAGDIVYPRIISDDFDASVAVFSQRLTDGMVTLLKDAAIFSIIGLNPILQLSSEDSQDLQRFYEEIMAIAKDSSMPYPFETVLYTLVSYFSRISQSTTSSSASLLPLRCITVSPTVLSASCRNISGVSAFWISMLASSTSLPNICRAPSRCRPVHRPWTGLTVM